MNTLDENMLELAFQFRDAKLWDVLYDNDIFAVTLSDGNIGYCSVMGKGGEHYGMVLYVGESGWLSFIHTCDMSEVPLNSVEGYELGLSLDCINCDFMPGAKIDPKWKKAVDNYAKPLGIKLRKPYLYPDIVKHSPFKMPWNLQSEQDKRYLCEALEAALEIATTLKQGKTHIELGFEEEGISPYDENQFVPLLTKENGLFSWGKTKLPNDVYEEYGIVPYNDKPAQEAISELRKSGAYECRLIHLIPFGKDQGKAPVLFPMLLCMDCNSGLILPTMKAQAVEPESHLDALAEAIIHSQRCPKEIRITDAMTEALLSDFCKKNKIILTTQERLPDLEEAWKFLMEQFR